ncbi:phosphatidate cytidylyltransferase [Dialister sp.]|jgi:phosphatidate cytidylyltransferase|uniref:phosphatidate cytidylyltransferase n=1 Tax=Dialister sp. TaxID=1955814 RepID=UPI003A5C19F4
MKVRVITAVVGIIAVLALVWLGGWFLTGAVAIVSLIALWEYVRMLDHISIHVYKKPAALALVIPILAAGFYSVKIFIAAFFLCFCLLLFLILAIKKEEMTNLIYTSFGTAYFGIGFGTLALLRGSHELLPPAAVNVDPGIFLILLALVTTWASDSFAYLAGRSLGKHKMAPHISPNKTVEGLIGGAMGCVVLGMILSFAFKYNLTHGFLLSLIAAVMAPVGDLFESYIKRACDIKDSGNILPGHGGMMDRFDSLLFVAPSLAAVLAILN